MRQDRVTTLDGVSPQQEEEITVVCHFRGHTQQPEPVRGRFVVLIAAKAMGPTLILEVTRTTKVVPEALTALAISVVEQARGRRVGKIMCSSCN